MTPAYPIIRAAFLCLVFVVVQLAILNADSGEFDALMRQVTENNRTKKGYRYQEQFLNAIEPALVRALDSCSGKPDTKEPASIIFIVRADGRVTRILHSPNIPFGDCVASKLSRVSTLPRPPGDNYAVAVGAANHAHEKPGPPDRPQRATTDQFKAYEKAIAPYVAKARATYPEAKKRFLAGLPAGYRFSVRVPLFDPDGNREDSFVRVYEIKNGKIMGVIESELNLVKSYKTGQQITCSESKIDNWLILRPNGTEEGNYVGKFLDHYRVGQ
jgi:uncharacterized protein YegJ (DUF2314 family)